MPTFVLPPERRERARQLHRDFVAGRTEESAGEWEVLRKDGTPLRVFVTATRLELSDGTRYKVTTVADVSERERHRQALARQTERLWERDREAHLFRERLKLAQQAAGFGIFDFDVESGAVAADDPLRALYGLSDDEPFTFEAWNRQVVPEELPGILQAVEQTLATGKRLDHRYRIRRDDGTERVVHATAAVTEWRDGRPVRLTGINFDVTEEEAAQVALRRLAFEDALTGLPNRAAAMHLLEGLPKGTGHHLVAVFDVEGLRRINQRSGERVGDAVLRQVAARLSAAFPGFVGRLGMDKFVAVGGFPAREQAEAALAEALRALEPAFEVGGLKVAARLRGSHAIVAAAEGRPGPELLEDALLALDEAKRRHVRQFAYVPALGEAAREERLLADALEAAVEARAFRVVYQPQVDLLTGALVGVEGLLRWTLPGRGPVSPETFIPLAERTGAILAIGELLGERAAADADRWSAAGAPLEMISLNVSPVQVADAGFLDYVRRLRAAFAALPHAIKLEIELTETDYIHPSSANVEKLQAVRALGVGVAIDDFGKGYSSLAYLERFPVDMIKIDRSFVARVEESAYTRKLVGCVGELAATIGADVLAEGVETQEQARIAAREGARLGQGFSFSRPVPADEVPDLARRGFRVPGRARPVETASGGG